MSRSWWSDRPLGVKLSTLVATGSLALVVFGGIAVTALQETDPAAPQIIITEPGVGYRAELTR